MARFHSRSGSITRGAVSRAWLLVPAVLVLLPVSMSQEDTMASASAAGEVDLAAASAPAAAERYADWEARMHAAAPAAAVRREQVADGIRLLADAVSDATPNTEEQLAEQLAAMRWHGEQLALQPADTTYADYADAGHAHAAFAHAAMLLGALPEVPGGVTEALTRAADAVDARPLAAQGPAVRTFFRRAAAAVAAARGP